MEPRRCASRHSVGSEVPESHCSPKIGTHGNTITSDRKIIKVQMGLKPATLLGTVHSEFVSLIATARSCVVYLSTKHVYEHIPFIHKQSYSKTSFALFLMTSASCVFGIASGKANFFKRVCVACSYANAYPTNLNSLNAVPRKESPNGNPGAISIVG